MVLVLPVLLCTGVAANTNRAADRIIATENTPMLEQIGHRLKDLPRDEAEALVQACVTSELHCDPSTDRACAERLFVGRARVDDQVAHDRARILLCIDAKLDGTPLPSPEPERRPAARGPNRGETSTAGSIFSNEPEPESSGSTALLAAGAIGGIVLAFGAAGAFLLLGRSEAAQET